MKLERYDPPRSFPTKPLPWIQCVDGDWCKSEDVAELEAKYAQLEKQLEGYTEAFDCIRDAMLFAERAIADPDSVAVVVMPDVVEEPLNAEMLDIIELLHHCSDYWSEYYVPIGIVQRMEKVIAQAKEGANE